jgi:methionyl-tRNA synthetase
MLIPKPDNLAYEDFVKLDIRAGTVIQAEPVPKSKKLLKLNVDFGVEIGSRVIVAGIAESYDVVSIIGQKVVAVLNLAPRSIMGLTSNGMLLAGRTDDQSHISLVQCQGVRDGSNIG